MKWIDINEIAIELIENYPEIDPKNILFTDLHKWILSLEDFEDEPNRSNEQILEAIQMAWIEELE
ncbi:MAG: Fe-S cluster assembly protein IscX [SAR86 cluster bacterium]|nr:Fe-S cluster assembly protein IscX [SAR86 cluster bacterium]|tara:strand:- start:275 stop:469 length:195 start_codon:yes stop_codon:yes gene_type:complete